MNTFDTPVKTKERKRFGLCTMLLALFLAISKGKPEKVLFEDKHILVTVMLYTLSVAVNLVYFE